MVILNWSLKYERILTTLHFYSPWVMFNVFYVIFYIFLFCVSLNYLTISCNYIIDDFITFVFNLSVSFISGWSTVSVSVSRSVVPDSLRPHGLQSTRLLCPWDFPDKDTGVGCHFLLQGIFPTQGSNPGLLHCRQILYRLSYKGSFTVYLH